MTEKRSRGTLTRTNFLISAVIVIFFGLLFRNYGMYPVVFADEYNYSKFSRLLPLEDSKFPDYLYLAIYRLASICGDGFLDCARVLNTLFFVAAIPFIYLTARRVSTRWGASIVSLLALLGPINSYTAYFMPEPLYFFSFWLLTWFILRLDNTPHLRSWCFAGMLLGFAALIKPHALFLLPAIIGYILYVNREKEDKWVLQALRDAIIFAAFAFVTKALIGYLCAGKAGLTIFGSFYTPILTQTISDSGRYLALLSSASESAKGHVLATCLMFGAPIAFAIKTSFDSAVSKEEVRARNRIAVYTVLVLVNLILVVSLFQAAIVDVEHLFMRYYNFAFPLLLVIAISLLSLEQTTNMLKRRAIIAFPIGGAILYAVYTFLVPFTPNFIDCPELNGFTSSPIVFYVLSGISLVALTLWVYSARAGAKIFVYLFLPLAVGFPTYHVNHELREHLVPDVFDQAGIFVKQFLPNEERSKLVIAGSEPGGFFRSLFYIDNPEASWERIPEGAAYDLSKLPAGKEWILVIGDHPLPENTFYQIQMDGFTLARATGTNTIDFREFSWPGIISSSYGLSSAEPFGRWSSGDVVTLEFCQPLPEKFAVHLIAHAFGPNIGKEFVAHVADSGVKFTLGASSEERVLEFSNPRRSKIIKIDVPSPCSPKEPGLSGGGERRLGIGFRELRIEPL